MAQDYKLDKATIRKLSKLVQNYKELKNTCKKIAFSLFANSFRQEKFQSSNTCCGENFGSSNELKRHLSKCHSKEISKLGEEIEDQFSKYLSEAQGEKSFISHMSEDLLCEKDGMKHKCTCEKNFKVVLYYQYVDIENPLKEISGQKALCRRLDLTGKIRVAREGINGTAEGCECAIGKYIEDMLDRFPGMAIDDFKLSDGNGTAFDHLKVAEYEELCSLGIPSEDLKATDGGQHLTPKEFHEEVEKQRDDTIVLDCRNFYESKIGYFKDAIRPDLRKFSYFPTYVNKNSDMFEGKRVLMYCTGGIRCERASAYIKKTVVCKDVLQLKGGIHKYLEKYPNGHYKGKLFVFDERYSIGGESLPPVAKCKYCDVLYDHYKLCTSPSCRQLVLSCDKCRSEGKTTCCNLCKVNAKLSAKKEECECTMSRDQVPIENMNSVIRESTQIK